MSGRKASGIMSNLQRREFLTQSAAVLAMGPFLAGCDRLRDSAETGADPSAVTGATPKMAPAIPAGEARYYETLPGDSVQCRLCFRECILPPGGRSPCRVRENRQGQLFSLVYGRPSAVHLDPVEKEPMHHMLPGENILCVGTAGCNFFCRQCHNWHLSQRTPEEMGRVYNLPPHDLVALARRQRAPIISFTYNEPTIFIEYMTDIARLAQAENIRILFHSNGAMSEEPLKEWLTLATAACIDLKGFTEEVYRSLASARLAPVLKNLETIKQAVWLELVNLIIPTVNDDPNDIRRMCRWIRETLGPDTPIHFSRFTPAYRLTQLPPTPVHTLEIAYEIASEEGLEFVSIGNVPGHQRNSTFCPGCGERIIHRRHFHVLENRVENGGCAFCGRAVPGIWS